MDQHALTKNELHFGVIAADTREALASLPSDTFNVAITSPPYYWARDYGYEGQIGHEDSPEAYVSVLADVFDEVKRVLHPEGVFYLNIGDTYYSGNGQPHGQDPRSPSRNFMRKKMRSVDRSGWGIPKKTLIGIPWQLALEMQSRGWAIRSDIIWNRCNAFTEPTARDRPHRQYEHVFLFTRSRFYSYDRSQLGDEEDVWNIPIQRGKRTAHNAAFPVALAERCILTASPGGGHVLDPFLGSGTTLEAALRTGRNAVGIELGASYVDEALSTMRRLGCGPTDWAALSEAIQSVPQTWDSWAGNKDNFRKPGTR